MPQTILKRKNYLLLFFCVGKLYSQCICFSNASFEGTTGIGIAPTGFSACAGTPDTQLQSAANPLALPAPTNGSAFLGLYIPNAPGPSLTSGEEAGIALCSNLIAGNGYFFKIDLCKVNSVAFNITNSPVLEIWGGSANCLKTQLLYSSPTITHTNFITYCSIIVPSSNYSHITFKIVRLNASNPAYLGIDNFGCALCVLPIELVDFSANCNPESKATIKWTTATEKNSDWFFIERSFDAENYELIAKIKAQGNSNAMHDYEYIDTYKHDYATCYYRLREVSINGEKEVFDPVALENCGKEKTAFTIYNNDDKGYLMLTSRGEQSIHITIKNIIGQNLFEKDMKVIEGKSKIEIPYRFATNETYIILLTIDNKINVIKYHAIQ